MSWLFDNASIIYVLLGIVALGFATAGWLTRRVKFLALAASVVVLIVLFWLLARAMPTDSQRIEANVRAVADAVARDDPAGVFKHLARDFQHRQLTRAQMVEIIRRTVQQFKINELKVWEFDITDVSRSERTARAHFRVTVFDKDGPLGVVLCLGTFALEDDQWKLRAIDFRDPHNPEQPMPAAP